jgi:hypothetical protein
MEQKIGKQDVRSEDAIHSEHLRHSRVGVEPKIRPAITLIVILIIDL